MGADTLGDITLSWNSIGGVDLTEAATKNAIAMLIARSHDPQVIEVLLALNATVEGQSTAHYLTDQLDGCNVSVSRLAQGVPIGGELDYLDEGTLAAAVKSRKAL